MREIDAKNPPWARIKAHGGLSFDLRKEKLEKLVSQEKEKQHFLEEVFRSVEKLAMR